MNTLELAQIFQSELDQQILAGATSSWMEENLGGLVYNGGNTVRIPKTATDGLGNYSRSNGFPSGSINLSFETKTMAMDRAQSFSLDAMDVNESNFVLNASNVMSVFQKTEVIPEIDAYRYSKIASLAIAAGRASGGYTPGVADILTKLRADIATIQDVIGADKPLVITMSTATLNILENSSELTRFLNTQQFPVGGSDISLEVHSIDGVPIIEAPSARLKTVYDFNDGSTASGFTVDAAAKTINWIICPQNVPMAISKTDTIRIFSPEQNQKADAYLLQYRKYHDLWLTDNGVNTVFVNIKEALA